MAGPTQDPETMADHMPCSNCGSDHLIQHNNQSEDLYLDNRGDPKYYEPRHTEATELWCPECDEKLWESDD